MLAEVLARMEQPCLWRILVGPSLAIIPKIENCLKWRRALAGSDPAKKWTTGAGVAL